MFFCSPTQVDLHVENAEPLLKNIFSHSDGESADESRKDVRSEEERRTRRRTDDGHRGDREKCLSSTNSYLDKARAMVRSL